MATRQDSPALVALLNEAFRTPMDQSTWEWYVYGNPQGASRVYLAVEGERRIVGMFGFAPVRLKVEDVTLDARFVHHLVLAPAYRDGLSFVALSRHALKAEGDLGVPLAIGPPNRQSYPIHKTLMKWTDFGHLDRLYKLSPSAHPHNCREVRRFDDSFDRFYNRLSAGLCFCVAKTAPWMNWRFLDRPGSPYTVYGVERDGELAGYTILKTWQEPDGYRKAHVMDLHATDEAALSHLIAAAESYAAGCDELNLWAVPGYPYREFLASRGFISRDDARQPLIARPLNGVSVRFSEGRCAFAYGDGDCQY